MTKEIPGFYYDEQKKRYFSVKGPIPGSKFTRRPSESAAIGTGPAIKSQRTRVWSLMKCRELEGKSFCQKRQRCDFQTEIMANRVSHPQVWSYEETNDCSLALEIIPINTITSEGEIRVPTLFTGGSFGYIQTFFVGKDGPTANYSPKKEARHVWPLNGEETEVWGKPPADLWPVASFQPQPSCISCIRSPRNPSATTNPGLSYAFITTLAGSIYVMNLADPFDPNSPDNHLGKMDCITSVKSTVWTGDCSSKNKNKAVIGTDRGASLVDFEGRKISWVLRSKSAVFAQQFDQSSGNVVLCGLRNGAILTVDIRERPRTLTAGADHPGTTYMPKSVASLLSLQLYDQYFLASSMDNSIKLYDQRKMGKGHVQSYEGHVNTHTRIQLGVDPLEKLVVSGGTDSSLRAWSIKSGKLLFEKRVSSSYPLSVCSRAAEGVMDYCDERGDCWESWHGSSDGLFYTRWS